MILMALHWCPYIWKSKYLFQSLYTSFGRQSPSPVSLSREYVWAVWWCLDLGLLLGSSVPRSLPGSIGGQIWNLGPWDQPGAWFVEVGLEPAFTWTGQVFESVVMGLGVVSAWVDLDSGKTRCQGPLGWAHFLGRRDLVHYWDGSLVTGAWML